MRAKEILETLKKSLVVSIISCNLKSKEKESSCYISILRIIEILESSKNEKMALIEIKKLNKLGEKHEIDE